MHLMRGLSTIRTTKPKQKKLTRAQHHKLVAEHREYTRELKQKGMHSQILSFNDYVAWIRGKQPAPAKSSTLQNKRQQQDFVPETTGYRRRSEAENIPSFDGKTAVAAKKESRKYTGTLVKGISQTHKSNLVPVINDEEILDIRHMRR